VVLPNRTVGGVMTSAPDSSAEKPVPVMTKGVSKSLGALGGSTPVTVGASSDTAQAGVEVEPARCIRDNNAINTLIEMRKVPAVTCSLLFITLSFQRRLASALSHLVCRLNRFYAGFRSTWAGTVGSPPTILRMVLSARNSLPVVLDSHL
jgi:hypothetical protein